MTTAQCFAQISGAVYLLVGIKISSRLHRYLRKPTQFGILGGFLYTGFVLCSLAVN